MTGSRIRLVAVSAALLASAGLTAVLTSRVSDIAPGSAVDLNAIIPLEFGAFKALPDAAQLLPDATTKVNTGNVYSQVVSRGYKGPDGSLVMLLVAYGPAQDANLKAHRPELCYTAAGFRILSKFDGQVRYSSEAPAIMLTRLTAVRESRFEPVSYWMRVGEELSHGVIDRQIIRIKYGLRGIVPDGALIRVSTLGLQADESFRVQDRFIRELLAALKPADRQFFTGKT